MDLYLPIKPEGPHWLLIMEVDGERVVKRNAKSIGFPSTAIPRQHFLSLSNLDKFPAQLHDCKGAVRWLRANAKKFGYDPNKIVAAGTSAGGHLSALMATSYGVLGLEGKTGGNLAYSSKGLGLLTITGQPT